jgi:NADH:ubiquinone oxidoreductase subunit H
MDLGFFVVLLLLILLIASLFTVIERKVLGSAQRRMGPTYAGWYGLVQVVGDGAKLVWAWVIQERLMVSVVGSLVSVYGAGVFLWMELEGYGTEVGVYLLLLLLGMGHVFLVTTSWALFSSVWSRLGILRVTLTTIMVELVLFSLLGVLGLWDVQVSLTTQSFRSWLGMVGLAWCLLLDFGRIPYDLVEAESELVAGVQTEYAGLGYALLASVEYSAVFLGSCLFSVLLGCPCILSLFLFGLWVWIRAVLPRFRVLDVVSSLWSLFFPLVLSPCVLSLSFCLVLLDSLVEDGIGKEEEKVGKRHRMVVASAPRRP